MSADSRQEQSQASACLHAHLSTSATPTRLAAETPTAEVLPQKRLELEQAGSDIPRLERVFSSLLRSAAKTRRDKELTLQKLEKKLELPAGKRDQLEKRIRGRKEVQDPVFSMDPEAEALALEVDRHLEFESLLKASSSALSEAKRRLSLANKPPKTPPPERQVAPPPGLPLQQHQKAVQAKMESWIQAHRAMKSPAPDALENQAMHGRLQEANTSSTPSRKLEGQIGYLLARTTHDLVSVNREWDLTTRLPIPMDPARREAFKREHETQGISYFETDLETSKFFVETTLNAESKLPQIKRTYLNPKINPSGKPVIVLAPNMPDATIHEAYESLHSSGVPVIFVKTRSELEAWVRKFYP